MFIIHIQFYLGWKKSDTHVELLVKSCKCVPPNFVVQFWKKWALQPSRQIVGGTKIDQNRTKIQTFSILLNILVLPIGYSLTCLILHEATILCSSVFLSLKFPSSFSRFLEEDLITTLQDFVLKWLFLMN